MSIAARSRPYKENRFSGMYINKPPPHSKNLRKGRYSSENQIYLLTTVTEQRRLVFTDFALARELVHALHFQETQQRVESLAFVIMPDHLHWLFALRADYSLATVMHSVKSYSAQKIQKASSFKKGRLWQPGYHDHALRKEEDVVQVARYIIANPLRASLVERVGDYPLWDAVWL